MDRTHTRRLKAVELHPAAGSSYPRSPAARTEDFSDRVALPSVAGLPAAIGLFDGAARVTMSAWWGHWV